MGLEQQEKGSGCRRVPNAQKDVLQQEFTEKAIKEPTSANSLSREEENQQTLFSNLEFASSSHKEL